MKNLKDINMCENFLNDTSFSTTYIEVSKIHHELLLLFYFIFLIKTLF